MLVILYKQSLFVFAPQGRLFPTKWKQFSQAKTPEKVRPEGGLSLASSAQDLLVQTCSLPTGIPSARPDWGKVGAGKTKCGEILKCCKNAFGYWKWVRQQLRGYTRGDCFSKNDWIVPARVGYPSAARSAAPPRCAGEGCPLPPSASPTPPPEGEGVSLCCGD